jgi:transposase-like protein
MRQQFTPNQKATVALAALSGSQTINQIAAAHEVHPSQVKSWKSVASTGLPQLFTDNRSKEALDQQAKIDELHRVIGVRDAELEWLKKKTARLSC